MSVAMIIQTTTIACLASVSMIVTNRAYENGPYEALPRQARRSRFQPTAPSHRDAQKTHQN